MKRIILLLIVLAAFAVPSHAQISCYGTLASVSACLHPGQWGEVTGMTGLFDYQGGGGTILNEYCVGCGAGGSFRAPIADDSILNYMDKGKWNPQTHEMFVLGAAHPAGCVGPGDSPTPPYCEVWFVKFNGDTGHWTQLEMPSDFGGYTTGTPPGFSYALTNGAHQDDWSALDTVHQDYYCFGFSNSAGDYRVFKYHIPDGTWTTLLKNYTLGATDTVDSQEWFPDQGAGGAGRLVYIVTDSIISGGQSKTVASQWNPSLSQWEYLNGGNYPNLPFPGTQGYAVNGGWLYAISRYDPVHHVLYFGGGAGTYACSPDCTSTSPNQLYAYQIYNDPYQPRPNTCNSSGLIAPGASPYTVGCTTALPTTGAPGLICMRCGLQEIDPVTGDLIIIVNNHGNGGDGTILEYRYHFGDAAWNLALPGGVPLDITSVAPFLTNTPYVTNDSDNYPMFNMVTFSVPDDGTYNGVIGYVKHVSPTDAHVYVQKVAQRRSLADKCGDPGVLNCWNFDSPTDIDLNHQALRYGWDAADGNLNNDPILMTQTNYPATGWRNIGESNTRAIDNFDSPVQPNVSVPQIDCAIKFDGCSLLIPMGQYNVEQTGQYDDNLDGKLGHPNIAICKDATNCPQGNVLWAQAMIYLSEPLVSDYVFQCSIQLFNTCYNSDEAYALQVNDGTNSTADKTLNCIDCNSGSLNGFCIAAGNPSWCTQSSVGTRLFIYNHLTDTNCAAGTYTITVVNSVSQAVLNASPSTVGQACARGTFLAENVGAGSGGAQAWKLLLLVSNALPIPANGNCECEGEVITRGNTNFPPGPITYDNKGNNPYTPNIQGNFRYIPNGWHEITEEVIVGDSNVYNTEIKLWMDGQLAYDFTQGYLLLDGDDHGYGLGQIQLETYTTKRDGFWLGSAAAPAHYDNVITSTNVIAFNSDGGGNVVPCSSPAKVVFTSQPSNAVLGASLGPVTGQIQDSSNVWCTTATNVVSLSRAPGTTWNGLSSSSSLTKTASGGLVTWTDLSVVTTTGSGSILATSLGLADGLSNSINITGPPSNLTLSKSGPSSVNTSSPMTYSIGLGNSGGTTSGTSVTVAEQLATGVTASACTAGTGVASVSCTNLGTPGALVVATITLNSGLAAGATNGTAAFTVVTTSPSSAGSITNYVSVDPTGGSSPATPGAGCLTSSCANWPTTVNMTSGAHRGATFIKP